MKVQLLKSDIECEGNPSLLIDDTLLLTGEPQTQFLAIEYSDIEGVTNANSFEFTTLKDMMDFARQKYPILNRSVTLGIFEDYMSAAPNKV